MKRYIIVGTAVVATLLLGSAVALAGNAHFVGTPKVAITSDGDLRASGKVAGLGNETQIHVEVSAEAACMNRGGNFPEAENKETFSAKGDFPVQNGKADFRLRLKATFQPKCSPPMTVVWGPVTITVSGDSFETFSYTV